jgi:hypothetical protein
VSIYVSGLVWVVGAAVVAGLIAVLIHRVSAGANRSSNNDVAGQVFTIVAGLHAVLLAFVLISLFDAVSSARSDSTNEANNLVAVSWAADSLPEPAHSKVKQLTSAYSNTVVSKEWPQMSDTGKVDAAEGWQQLDELRDTIANTQTADGDDWQASRKQAATDQLWGVYQARQARLDAAASNGVSSVVWFALVLGSAMSMSLIYLHGGPKMIPHALIAGILAATITLLLFAISELQNPFSGGAAVGPDAFRAVLDRLT